MDPRNLDLEAAIANDPNDVEPYRVYADWLEGQGDIRAELIRLQLAADPRASPSKPVRKLFAQHRVYLLGPLARFANSLKWRYGFVHEARFDDQPAPITANLDALLEHPSGRFLVELHLRSRALEDVIAQIAGRVPRSLRTLVLAHETARAPSIDAIALPALYRLELAGRFALSPRTFAAHPRLHHLSVRDVGAIALHELAMLVGLFARGACELSAIDLPAVTIVDVECGSRETAAAIAHARWPRIERLDLDLAGSPATLDDLAPLFRVELPALERLVISGATFADELCRLVAAAPFAARLRELGFPDGDLSNAGVQRLAGLAKLESLVVYGCHLDDDGLAGFDGRAVEIVGDPRYDRDGE